MKRGREEKEIGPWREGIKMTAAVKENPLQSNSHLLQLIEV